MRGLGTLDVVGRHGERSSEAFGSLRELCTLVNAPRRQRTLSVKNALLAIFDQDTHPSRKYLQKNVAAQ